MREIKIPQGVEFADLHLSRSSGEGLHIAGVRREKGQDMLGQTAFAAHPRDDTHNRHLRFIKLDLILRSSPCYTKSALARVRTVAGLSRLVSCTGSEEVPASLDCRPSLFSDHERKKVRLSFRPYDPLRVIRRVHDQPHPPGTRG